MDIISGWVYADSMKKIILIFALALIFVLVIFKFSSKTVLAPTPEQAVGDYKNIAYQVEGQEITLKNGIAETPVEMGSSIIGTTKFFGNTVEGDFNSDGKKDIAFILFQDFGGTGKFIYVVAAVSTPSGLKGTNAIFLGDRISPQTTEFRNGQIIVNYADRKVGESFSDQPSVGVSKYLKVDGLQLLEIKK